MTKETEDDVTTYAVGVMIGGRPYGIVVLEDGTLTEMSLDVGEDEVRFAACPLAVQKTFHKETNDAKIESVGKDVRYGVPVYEAEVAVGGKEYSIVVAEDGTLVEKTLIVAEEEIEFAHCPAAVQKALRELSEGGELGDITRSSGIGVHVYEAAAQIHGKGYVLQVSDRGLLISKALDEEDEDDPARQAGG